MNKQQHIIEDFKPDVKMKHLEFIQNIISRMNSNSFVIKGWVVTLIAAVFALTAGLKEFYIHLINYFIIPIFWLLDSLYLSQERQYRALYNDVRKITYKSNEFELDATKYNKNKATIICSFFSKTLLLFYCSLIIISLIIMYFLNV